MNLFHLHYLLRLILEKMRSLVNRKDLRGTTMTKPAQTIQGGRQKWPRKNRKKQGQVLKSLHTQDFLPNSKLNAYYLYVIFRHTVEREHADDPSSTSRGSSHHKVPRNSIPRAEQKHQNGRQEKDDMPPPSPIQHALGQVSSCTSLAIPLLVIAFKNVPFN